LLPSPTPTSFACVLQLTTAQPEMVAAAGTAFPVAPYQASAATRGLYSRAFGGLFGATPGSAFSFSAYLSGKAAATAGASGSTLPTTAAGGTLVFVVKTPALYIDSASFDCAFQVREPECPPSSIAQPVAVRSYA
jgi:hypothetical protein